MTTRSTARFLSVCCLIALAPGQPFAGAADSASPDMSRLGVTWQFAAPRASSLCLGPVTDGRSVYFTGGDDLYAVDPESGNLQWHVHLPLGSSACLTGGPVILGRLVCIPATDSKLYVIDTDRRSVIQVLRLSGTAASSPFAAGASVYLATTSGAVYDYAAAPDGKGLQSVWASQLGLGPFEGNLVAAGSNLYAATRDGVILALDAEKGAVLAQAALGSADSPIGLASDGRSVFATAGRTMVCLDATDLHTRWDQTLPTSAATAPVCSGGLLYELTTSGSLYALGADLGVEAWGAEIGTPGQPADRPIPAGNSILAAAGQGVFCALDADGDGAGHSKLLWQIPVLPPLCRQGQDPWLTTEITGATAAGGSVYVLSCGSILSCLSTQAADAQGPAIDLEYPPDGGRSSSALAVVSARVVDRAYGCAPGSIQVQLDGKVVAAGIAYDLATGRLEYRPEAPLDDGSHVMQVTASGSRGGSKTTRWTFHIDHAAPTPAVWKGAGATPGTATTHAAEPATVLPHPLPHPAMPAAGSGPAFEPNYVHDLKEMSHWQRFPITVYFIQDDTFTPRLQKAAIAGFSRWVTVTDSVVGFRVVTLRSEARVIVQFDPARGDGLTETESSGLEMVRASILLGIALPGHADEQMPLTDIECEAAHEFGHVLGLNGHSSNPLDLMYHTHVVGEPWCITSRDLNTLRADYSTLFGKNDRR